MNSKERFFAALEGKPCDRVPTMELIVDTNVCKQFYPNCNYYDFIERSDYYDLVVCASGVVDPGEPNWIDKSKKIFKDKWGVTKQFTNQFLPHTIGKPLIQCQGDLDNYTMPDYNDEAIINDVKEVINRFKGSKAIGFLGEDVFASTQYLMGGPEEMLVAMKLEPKLVKNVIKVVEKYHINLYKNVIKEGMEIIILGDDYGTSRSSFISPDDFREFFYTGIKRIVKEVQALGAKIIKHTDGNVWSLMDYFVETGIDAMGPLQHECGMELKRVKKHYPDLTVVGNVPVDILISGTEDDVICATKDCIKRVSPGGRHIISSGNSITSDVPMENLKAMMEAVREFGRYPITL
jgi:uroporphyrinogen decarboxylase